MDDAACWACAMEKELRDTCRDLRQRLQVMNPKTNRNYEPLYRRLIEADGSLRILLRKMDERRGSKS